MMTAPMKLKHACLFEEKLWKPSSIFKSRDITLQKKVQYNQSYDFPSCHVWMWQLHHKEWWAKTIDGFELWRFTRLLSVPWTTRRSNKSMLKEINLEYSLEGAMLKLKLQYFGQLMWRNYSLEKILLQGKIEGRRRRGWWRMRRLDGITNSMDMS